MHYYPGGGGGRTLILAEYREYMLTAVLNIRLQLSLPICIIMFLFLYVYAWNLLITIYRTKELSFCHKLKSSDLNIFSTWWCKPLIFQTQIILSITIYSLKYLISNRLGYKVIEIWKSKFVAKTKLELEIQNGSPESFVWYKIWKILLSS